MNEIPILNRLIALHTSSLPSYLVTTRPVRPLGDDALWAALDNVQADQNLMVEKISALVDELGDTANCSSDFPMHFAGWHDLSAKFLTQQSLKRQQNEIAAIEAISEKLPAGSPSRALAQEALGAAKAHAESLSEALDCQSTSA